MRAFLIAAGLLCLSTGAFAAEPPPNGFYVGGAVGVTEFDDDGAFNGFNFDDSDSSFGIYGGYKILKYLSVEARLLDLGSYDVEFVNFDLTGISTHVVGIIPFGTSGWELFGQLGLGRIDIDSNVGDEDETVGSAGIGVRWYPIEHLGLSLQIDAWAWEDDDGFDSYDVGVVSNQFAIHYLF